MPNVVAPATLVVRDDEEAIALFTQALRLRLPADTPLSPDKRRDLVERPAQGVSRPA